MPNINEVNGEDRQTTPQSPRHSRNNIPKTLRRQLSRHPSLYKSPSANAGPGWTSSLYTEPVSLTEGHEEFNDTELKFLHWLDAEIKKIDDFYREKEKVAAERYKLISPQLQALCQFRDTNLTNESNRLFQGISTPEPSCHRDRSGLSRTWNTLVSKLRTSLDKVSSAMPDADHERRVTQPELMAKPIKSTAGYVEYRVARRRLKQAIFEFYRGMELLKGYRSLNRIGLEKILAKFDKTAGCNISGEFADKLKSLHFNQSEELENLIRHTEVWIRFRISLRLGFICATF